MPGGAGQVPSKAKVNAFAGADLRGQLGWPRDLIEILSPVSLASATRWGFFWRPVQAETPKRIISEAELE
jgi:hypothetical protein